MDISDKIGNRLRDGDTVFMQFQGELLCAIKRIEGNILIPGEKKPMGKMVLELELPFQIPEKETEAVVFRNAIRTFDPRSEVLAAIAEGVPNGKQVQRGPRG